MRKQDEIEFYTECRNACNGEQYVAISPLEIADKIGMNKKRAMKLLWKWEDNNWWIGVMSGSSGCFAPGAPDLLETT